MAVRWTCVTLCKKTADQPRVSKKKMVRGKIGGNFKGTCLTLCKVADRPRVSKKRMVRENGKREEGKEEKRRGGGEGEGNERRKNKQGVFIWPLQRRVSQRAAKGGGVNNEHEGPKRVQKPPRSGQTIQYYRFQKMKSGTLSGAPDNRDRKTIFHLCAHKTKREKTEGSNLNVQTLEGSETPVLTAPQ